RSAARPARGGNPAAPAGRGNEADGLGQFGLKGQHAAFGEAQQGNQQQRHQRRQRGHQPRPVEAVGQQQQATAAGQHAHLVAAHLQTVAQPAPAFRQQAYAQPVGGHVLGGGGQIDQQQHAQQRRQPGAEPVRRRPQRQQGQQARHQPLQRQDPAASVAER